MCRQGTQRLDLLFAHTWLGLVQGVDLRQLAHFVKLAHVLAARHADNGRPASARNDKPALGGPADRFGHKRLADFPVTCEFGFAHDRTAREASTQDRFNQATGYLTSCSTRPLHFRRASMALGRLCMVVTKVYFHSTWWPSVPEELSRCHCRLSGIGWLLVMRSALHDTWCRFQPFGQRGAGAPRSTARHACFGPPDTSWNAERPLPKSLGGFSCVAAPS